MSLSVDTELQDRLESLEAQLDALRGNRDEALRRLAGRQGAASVRRRLAILIEKQEYRLVIEDCQGRALADYWIDFAACAHAAVGNFAQAEALLRWAIAERKDNLIQRTASFIADAAMHRAFSARPLGAALLPSNLGPVEKHIVARLVQAMAPAAAFPIARGNVNTELESQVLQKYLDALFLIGETSRASEVLKVLTTRTPIPLKAAQAFIQGVGKATKEIVDRFWNEHPDSFRAKAFACVLLARSLNDLDTAAARLGSLEPLATTVEHKEEMCELMYELASNGAIEFQKVFDTASRLLGPEARLLALIKADHLAVQGKHQEALSILENQRDETDPRWLRTYANAKIGAGEKPFALEVLKKLSAIQPTQEVLTAIGRLSGEQGNAEEERAALEKSLTIAPHDVRVRRRLAMLLAGMKDYAAAAKQFEVLHASDPEDEAITGNLAVSYSFCGEIEKALSVLVSKAGAALSPNLVRIRAQILEASGRVHEAFEVVHSVRSTNWDSPEFLVLYMQVAYAAGRENEAHEAFAKLHQLQQEGAVDDKLMRAVSLDEVRDWMSGVAQRNDQICRYILEGKITWLTAADIQREVPLWAWLLKTQRLNWVWDHPLNRATYCVYSTNGFRVYQSAEGLQTLESINAAEEGTPVAIDLSALITLVELGIFDEVAEYFGVLHVPSIYLARAIEDVRRLLPHQLSQKLSAAEIVDAVRSNKISVLTVERRRGTDWIAIDEHGGKEAQEFAGLQELLLSMHKHGLIDDDQMLRAQAVAHKPPKADAVSMDVGANLIVGGSTLVTLHGLGLLETLTRGYAVFINESDYDDLLARLNAFAALEQAREKHDRLWTTLRTDKRVRVSSVAGRLEAEQTAEGDARDAALASIAMAKASGLPLVADDRVTQTVVLNERKSEEAAAFGTDVIVAALMKSEKISPLQAGKLLLKLMEWRYRFILMPARAMKALAMQYKAHPPGSDMRKVARYVHDAMRDPGLFGGLEPTQPPVSIAVRLYQSWAQNVGELLMDIWIDEDLTEAYAQEFTEWAVTELLPSPPRSVDVRLQAAIASFTPMTVLTRALVQSADGENPARMNRGLRSIGAALGLEDSQYIELVTRVVRE